MKNFDLFLLPYSRMVQHVAGFRLAWAYERRLFSAWLHTTLCFPSVNGSLSADKGRRKFCCCEGRFSFVRFLILLCSGANFDILAAVHLVKHPYITDPCYLARGITYSPFLRRCLSLGTIFVVLLFLSSFSAFLTVWPRKKMLSCMFIFSAAVEL